MDTGELGPSICETSTIEYVTKNELEKTMYNSDESECDNNEDLNKAIRTKDDNEEEEGEIQIEEKDTKLDLTRDEEIIWSEIPQLQSLSFGEKNEMLVPLTGNSPTDIFNLLVDDSFYQLIADETNAYLREGISRISRPKPVTVNEMKIFFGLILHTGTIHLTRLSDYWNTDRLFNFSSFREAMGLDRFRTILMNLHFARNPKRRDPKPDDQFFKIRPLIDYFNTKMAAIYYPGRELFIDEPMVLWGGKIIYERNVPDTRDDNYGIKFSILKDGNGLVLNFFIYTGCLRDFGDSEYVVLQLLEDKLDKGHSVYIHNVYNSYSLSLQLLERKTYSTGMLSVNFDNIPENIKNKKLKRGETVAGYANGVMIGKWNNKKEIIYISTEFINNLQTYFNKKGIEKERPLAVTKYDKNIKGRGRQIEHSPCYPCQGKPMPWYRKTGIHIFQLLLLNSFVIYKKYVPYILFDDFRVEIIKYLLPRRTQNVPAVLGTTHYLTYCPINTEGKVSKRRCRYCHKKGVRKYSSFMCKVCKVGICLEPCFELYHKN